MIVALTRFVTRNSRAILFVTVALAAIGAYMAATMPTSVFPQTDFPRIVVLADNGVMPADQMMAEITRPIEEALNDVPGVISIRSTTIRGSAEISLFFSWSVDMVESLTFVQGRLAELAGELPASAAIEASRLTFSAFPVIGISVTSPHRDMSELWELARYDISPRLARVAGVARVGLLGGHKPEYHVVADPARLASAGLGLTDLVERLRETNVLASAGLTERNHQLFLALVSGRLKDADAIGAVVVGLGPDGGPIFLRDVATVERGVEPRFVSITADGVEAVLLNVESQPAASTVAVSKGVARVLADLATTLPADVRVASFYDQSILVRESVRSVWECILFGLVLSIAIIVAFLRHARLAMVAVVVIPFTVLITFVAMRLCHLSFNLMTLGGIAAAIGLVIDDAIVVIENIQRRLTEGSDAIASRRSAVEEAVAEISLPLLGSTLTPVVVFLPLAGLTGVAGVFFRSLALTMVTALLVSLVLALALTPNLALTFLRAESGHGKAEGRMMVWLLDGYEWTVRRGLAHPWIGLALGAAFLGATVLLYQRAPSDFLPEQDEGAFVLDYWMPPGASLSESNRVLGQVEELLRATPEVESYSRRLGAELGLTVTEPNQGDILVKLRHDRKRSTEEVTDELRDEILDSQPALRVEFAGILNDLIGDLEWSPAPIEIKVVGPDPEVERAKAREIAAVLEKVDGVVDVFDGINVSGPGLTLVVDQVAATRVGMSVEGIGAIAETAQLGTVVGSILKGDRPVDIRVRAPAGGGDEVERLRALPVRTPEGALVTLGELGRVVYEEGQTEVRREDLRQTVAVEARLSGRDLGSAIAEIKRRVAASVALPAGTTMELGGFYRQQQESFQNLLVVLLVAVVLVFTVLLSEFGRFSEALAIVWGALLSLFGVFVALALTGTTFNIISFLGAIIGFGIVAKNGILLLDRVEHYEQEGLGLIDALAMSGRRRLRPVLMTSLAAALGMLPLAVGLGAGAQMLRPLAIAVMGGLAVSVLLALLATPCAFYLIRTAGKGEQRATR